MQQSVRKAPPVTRKLLGCLLSKQKSFDNITLPETNSSHLKMVVSNRNLLFQQSIFRGELLVSGRVGGFADVILIQNFRRKVCILEVCNTKNQPDFEIIEVN